jgi:hypothetical protein
MAYVQVNNNLLHIPNYMYILFFYDQSLFSPNKRWTLKKQDSIYICRISFVVEFQQKAVRTNHTFEQNIDLSLNFMLLQKRLDWVGRHVPAVRLRHLLYFC